VVDLKDLTFVELAEPVTSVLGPAEFQKKTDSIDAPVVRELAAALEEFHGGCDSIAACLEETRDAVELYEKTPSDENCREIQLGCADLTTFRCRTVGHGGPQYSHTGPKGRSPRGNRNGRP
jgi:hypothetical protein